MTKPTGTSRPGDSKLVDFSEVRAQKMDEKRRRTERIFFRQLLGVYSVTGDESSMRSIELNDVSEDGLSFQTKFDAKNPWPTEDSAELPLRLYFSQDSYLPITVRIQNATTAIEEGERYVRYGCAVDKTLSTYAAYQQFVRFLKLYSEHSHKDKGDISVFYL